MKNLNLEKVKQSFVFGVIMKNDHIEMEGIKMRLQYQKIYISVKGCHLYDFLVFVRISEIRYIELYVSRTHCSRKLYNHWDFSTLKIYSNCKIYQPYFGYYCYLEFDSDVEVLYKKDE